MQLNSLLILFVTPFKKTQKTNQTKQTAILDKSYPVCLFHYLQFSKGINPYMLLVLSIFISKETINKIKSLIFAS